MVVKVGDDRALQAAVLAMKVADRDLKKRINDSTRSTFNAPWRQAISAGATTRLEQRVLVPGARIAAGNPPTFVAASSRRRLRGGLVPDTDGPAVEWGAADDTTTYTRTSIRGNRHQVTRHTARQLPRSRGRGKGPSGAGPVMRALAEIAPRAVSLWTQIIIRVYSDAAEGK